MITLFFLQLQTLPTTIFQDSNSERSLNFYSDNFTTLPGRRIIETVKSLK